MNIIHLFPYRKTENIYKELKTTADCYEDKAIIHHLTANLFPTMAYYKALIANGYDTDMALFYVRKETRKFCGSGAVESGNKIVLQKRLKQAGMRWEPETAQYLLTLKSKYESSRWEKDVVEFVRQHFCKKARACA